MATKRMKSREVRDNWRETLRHVEDGGEVVIEHYNRPIARIVPIEEPTMTFTSADLRDQVLRATDASDGEYDVDAITAEIVERHGAVPVDDIETGEFWEIVGKHAQDIPNEIDVDPATITRIDRLDYSAGNARGEGVSQRFSVGTTADGTAVVVLEDCWDDARGRYLAELPGRTDEDLKVTMVLGYSSLEEARVNRDRLACEDLDDEEIQLLSYERY